ncbi:hypothetical protein AKO1_007019 [Acrasis kona]|uniref:Uncharacterized protein n=1 Tax=Acrasis kona TaxID=1008807 RepID=A0AAW2YTE7_9EUKA
MKKYEEALTAVEIAITNADLDYRIKTIQRKAEILRALNRFNQIEKMYKEEVEREENDARKKLYQDEKTKISDYLSNLAKQNVHKVDETPWMRIKRLSATKPNYPAVGSSDWLLYTSSVEWEEQMTLVRKLQYGYNAQMPDLQQVSNIILEEPRAFALRSNDDLNKLQMLLSFSQQMRNAIGPQFSAEKIISTYNDRLKTEGWDKVRPALSVTVRALYMFTLVHLLNETPAESIPVLKKCIDVLELADKKWPEKQFPDRGATISNTFIRKLKVRLAESMSMVISQGAQDAVDLEHMKQLCNQVLSDCEKHPAMLHQVGAKFYLSFQIYCVADAHFSLSHYYKTKACEKKKDEKGYLIYDSEYLKKAITHYMYAARWYPEDEPNRSVVLWGVLECLILKGGASLNQLLDFRRDALEQDQKLAPVWGKVGDRKSEFAQSQIETIKSDFDRHGVSYDVVIPAMREVETNTVEQAQQVMDVLKKNNFTSDTETVKFISVLAKMKNDKPEVGANLD